MPLLLCVLLMSIAPAAPSQLVISTQNARQIALLHWYQANQATSFALGVTIPQVEPFTWGLAFDGANIWASWDSCGFPIARRTETKRRTIPLLELQKSQRLKTRTMTIARVTQK